MAAENALLLKEVFGESSESGDDFEHRSEIENVISETSEHSHNWEQIKEIKGLWLCRDFLSPKKQAYLLSAIRNEGWLIKSSHNQAMKFGDLPAWAVELSDSIREAVLSSNYVMDPLNLESFNGDEEGCLLPSNLLWREPFFDQLIANSYQPGEGICAHVDLMRFEDGIAIVSLESSCVMHFTSVNRVVSETETAGKSEAAIAKVPIFLTAGSLVLMSGEARYLWKHEINRKPGFQRWHGQEVPQERRISITLRRLCQAN